jgi:hypothetical protein
MHKCTNYFHGSESFFRYQYWLEVR